MTGPILLPEVEHQKDRFFAMLRGGQKDQGDLGFKLHGRRCSESNLDWWTYFKATLLRLRLQLGIAFDEQAPPVPNASFRLLETAGRGGSADRSLHDELPLVELEEVQCFTNGARTRIGCID
eukprot:5543307-Amphidinium_carterae.1